MSRGNFEDTITTTGLIDLHTHVFPARAPLGVDPDIHCLARGVTTVADAGTTGSIDFEVFKNAAANFKCSIFCFLHVSREGLTKAGCSGPDEPGECDEIENLNVQEVVDIAKANPDFVKGIKVRLSTYTADNGRNEVAAFRAALECRDKTGLPLMVHHALSSLPVDHVLGNLRQGDIYTHCFHSQDPNIVDRGCLLPSVFAARKRGVIFCVGHGLSSFSWKIAEVAAAEGFWPDVISSDLHAQNVNIPAFDLCNVMSKMLLAGMTVDQIIKAVTTTPAGILGLKSPANDKTVLEVAQEETVLVDSDGEARTTQKYFKPIAVFKEGEQISIKHVTYKLNQ